MATEAAKRSPFVECCTIERSGKSASEVWQNLPRLEMMIAQNLQVVTKRRSTFARRAMVDTLLETLSSLAVRGPSPEYPAKGSLPAVARARSTFALRAFGGQPSHPITSEGWWRGTESNCRHYDFQSYALPTELPRQAGIHTIRELVSW